MVSYVKLYSIYNDFKLNVKVYENANAKGVVCILHGMCEHHSRYNDFCDFLFKNGYTVVIYDHRGHGESVKHKSDLGYFYKNAYNGIVNDLKIVTDYIKNKYSNLKVYILSHSMGTLVLKCYLKKFDKEIDGCIFLGAPSKQALTFLALPIIKCYSFFRGEYYKSITVENIIFSKVSLRHFKTHKRYGWLSSNKNSISDFEDDENCGFTFTLNGFDMLFTLIKSAYSKNGFKVLNKNIPLHFMAGENDGCIISVKHFLKSIKTLEDVGYINVTYKLYKNMRHQLLHETDKKLIYKDILNKLDSFNGIKTYR